MRRFVFVVSALAPIVMMSPAAATPIQVARPVADQAAAKHRQPDPTPPTAEAACTPGNPIGGIIVKGGSDPMRPQKSAGGAKQGACTPPGSEKSISQKGVASTKSR